MKNIFFVIFYYILPELFDFQSNKPWPIFESAKKQPMVFSVLVGLKISKKCLAHWPDYEFFFCKLINALQMSPKTNSRSDSMSSTFVPNTNT